jgi:hypothetical protein
MKRNAATRIFTALMLASLIAPAWADRGDDGWGGGHRGGPPMMGPPGDFRGQDGHDRRYFEDRGYRFDNRYGHNHYYPPRGYVAPSLGHYRMIPYRGVRYYYESGIWYRRARVGFTVIVPPLGIIVPVLPPYYTTLYVGATPYYYADGTYYVWHRTAPGYEVVSAPDDSKIDQDASVPEDLYIYPKKGQSEDQQATDRFECHQWSVGQTGYDPSQPGGNVPTDQHAAKHDDYQRAMKACLEGRDYSVK